MELGKLKRLDNLELPVVLKNDDEKMITDLVDATLNNHRLVVLKHYMKDWLGIPGMSPTWYTAYITFDYDLELFENFLCDEEITWNECLLPLGDGEVHYKKVLGFDTNHLDSSNSLEDVKDKLVEWYNTVTEMEQKHEFKK